MKLVALGTQSRDNGDSKLDDVLDSNKMGSVREHYFLINREIYIKKPISLSVNSENIQWGLILFFPPWNS